MPVKLARYGEEFQMFERTISKEKQNLLPFKILQEKLLSVQGSDETDALKTEKVFSFSSPPHFLSNSIVKKRNLWL